MERLHLGQSWEDEDEKQDRQQRGKGVDSAISGAAMFVGEGSPQGEVGGIDEQDHQEGGLPGVVLPPGSPLGLGEDDAGKHGEDTEEVSEFHAGDGSYISFKIAGFDVAVAEPSTQEKQGGGDHGAWEVPEEDAGKGGKLESFGVWDLKAPDGHHAHGKRECRLKDRAG